MSLSKGDAVRIKATNGYDEGDVLPSFAFTDETGVVAEINHAKDGSITAYQIKLDDEKKHTFLSGGDDFFTWPFYEDELEPVSGA